MFYFFTFIQKWLFTLKETQIKNKSLFLLILEKKKKIYYINIFFSFWQPFNFILFKLIIIIPISLFIPNLFFFLKQLYLVLLFIPYYYLLLFSLDFLVNYKYFY
jgi:hypothetical protein